MALHALSEWRHPDTTSSRMSWRASASGMTPRQKANTLATAHGATVKAFWVVSLQEVREDKPIPADWPDAIDELIESHSEELAQLHGIEGVVTYGGPREELGQAGRELDLLIVGSRSSGPISRTFHGSVSRYLVRHATCPLLVVPRRTLAEPEQIGDRAAGTLASSGG
jgi:nucleotide-binding universal stress UspA family protein